MAQKTVWLTWMPAGENAPAPQAAVAAMSKLGLAVNGAPWVHAPQDYAWNDLVEHHCGAEGPDVWVIAGTAAEWADPAHRLGLSMVASNVRADRKKPMRTVVLGLDGMPKAEALPTLLRSADLIDGAQPSWGAKIVIAANSPAKPGGEPFRLRTIAQRMLGFWVEVGPTEGEWAGVMFGVAGAKIGVHAVGPKGGLPERTTLEFKLEGLELEIGDTTFVANAVANKLGPDDSYYLRIDGTPTRFLIGQHPDNDPDVWVVEL